MQESDKFKFELGKIHSYDQGGYHTRVEVFITDKLTGRKYKRIGDGRQIGNFHPIWINWGGKKIQLERLLDD